MKRRDFLKTALAVPTAAYLPYYAQPFDIAAIRTRLAKVSASIALRDSYFVFIHPSSWFDLRWLRARELWRDEYRTWRQRRRDFGCAAPETFGDLYTLLPL